MTPDDESYMNDGGHPSWGNSDTKSADMKDAFDDGFIKGSEKEREKWNIEHAKLISVIDEKITNIMKAHEILGWRLYAIIFCFFYTGFTIAVAVDIWMCINIFGYRVVW